MRMKLTEERQKYLNVMEKNGATRLQAIRLFRLACRHERWAVAECNRELTEKERSLWQKVKRDIIYLVKDINGAMTVNLYGDPRGYTTKLHLPSGEYNTWGGKEEGYGVPTNS